MIVQSEQSSLALHNSCKLRHALKPPSVHDPHNHNLNQYPRHSDPPCSSGHTKNDDQIECTSHTRYTSPQSCTSLSSGFSSPQSMLSPLIFSSNSSISSHSSPAASERTLAGSSSQTNTSPRRQPRIQVSFLLADSQSRTYHLEVIQQPQKTAEFGSASLSRLPLTPPIIVQLTVRDTSGNSIIPEAELPFLIAHLSLYSEDGLTQLDMGSAIGRDQSPPILYGNLVSSLDQLEDLQGNKGLFFLFPDVSIRFRGRFQLGVTLLRISGTNSSGNLTLAEHGTILAETRTETFDVLPLSQYTAAPPTRLTQCFLEQGARMFTFMSQPGT